MNLLPRQTTNPTNNTADPSNTSDVAAPSGSTSDALPTKATESGSAKASQPADSASDSSADTSSGDQSSNQSQQQSSSSDTSKPPSTTNDPPNTTADPPNQTTTIQQTTAVVTAAPDTTESTITNQIIVTANQTAPAPDITIETPLPSQTTVTTQVDGHLTTFVTAAPTSLSRDTPGLSDIDRTALIVGTTTGGVILLSACLAILFLVKRAKNRKLGFIEALVRGRREARGAGGLGLLDDEFDDDDVPPMGGYRDSPISHPSPSLFRARASETGSAFHEGVWPPPAEESRFVDPFVGSIKEGSQIDLSSIVDDVMGPAPSGDHDRTMSSSAGSTLNSSPLAPASHRTMGSMSSIGSDHLRGLSSSTAYHPFGLHTQDLSTGSTTSLSPVPLNSDVLRSTAPPPSYTPPGGTLPNGAVTPYPMSLLGLPAGAAQPKKPSPLIINAVSPETYTPPTNNSAASLRPEVKNWIERSPKKKDNGLT